MGMKKVGAVEGGPLPTAGTISPIKLQAAYIDYAKVHTGKLKDPSIGQPESGVTAALERLSKPKAELSTAKAEAKTGVQGAGSMRRRRLENTRCVMFAAALMIPGNRRGSGSNDASRIPGARPSRRLTPVWRISFQKINNGYKDLSGMRFGRLVALSRSYVNRRSKWVCQCDCGTLTVVDLGNLRPSGTQSCGCLHREIARVVNTRHGDAQTRRGNCVVEYRAWSHAKARCYSPNDKRYADYGGRGITMCERWRKFALLTSSRIWDGGQRGDTVWTASMFMEITSQVTVGGRQTYSRRRTSGNIKHYLC